MYPAQICNMHFTHNQFSEKFKMAENNSQWPIYCDFSYFISIILPCGRDSTSCILLKFVLHAANNQFSDNLNNGGGLLSSVLLFEMILTFKRWLEAEAYFRRRRALFRITYTCMQLKHNKHNSDWSAQYEH